MKTSTTSISIFTYIDRYTPFLDLWVHYYKKNIPNIHIYILQRSDSIFDLNLHVSSYSYDHIYIHKIDTTKNTYVVDMHIFSNMQRELLSTYDIVLYADIDEIIAHENLYDILHTEFDTCLVTKGIEIIQKVDIESPFSFKTDILNQRNYMIYSDWYNKPSITNAACNWTNGKHNQGIYNNYIDGLYLIHMGKICIELFKFMWQTTIDMYSTNNCYVESYDFDNYYTTHFSNNAIKIPDNIKQLIKLI